MERKQWIDEGKPKFALADADNIAVGNDAANRGIAADSESRNPESLMAVNNTSNSTVETHSADNHNPARGITEPDEDELDALLAEGAQQSSNQNGGTVQAGSAEDSATGTEPSFNDFEDEEAILREMEAMGE
jgi:hypothetical protein